MVPPTNVSCSSRTATNGASIAPPSTATPTPKSLSPTFPSKPPKLSWSCVTFFVHPPSSWTTSGGILQMSCLRVRRIVSHCGKISCWLAPWLHSSLLWAGLGRSKPKGCKHVFPMCACYPFKPHHSAFRSQTYIKANPPTSCHSVPFFTYLLVLELYR